MKLNETMKPLMKKWLCSNVTIDNEVVIIWKEINYEGLVDGINTYYKGGFDAFLRAQFPNGTEGE